MQFQDMSWEISNRMWAVFSKAIKRRLLTLNVSPKAHGSYLHGRVTDAAEIFAGTREQFPQYAFHKKTENFFSYFLV